MWLLYSQDDTGDLEMCNKKIKIDSNPEVVSELKKQEVGYSLRISVTVDLISYLLHPYKRAFCEMKLF